jgi:hypothetical protein
MADDDEISYWRFRANHLLNYYQKLCPTTFQIISSPRNVWRKHPWIKIHVFSRLQEQRTESWNAARRVDGFLGLSVVHIPHKGIPIAFVNKVSNSSEVAVAAEL